MVRFTKKIDQNSVLMPHAEFKKLELNKFRGNFTKLKKEVVVHYHGDCRTNIVTSAVYADVSKSFHKGVERGELGRRRNT